LSGASHSGASPEVSIVVPTRDRGSILRARALQAALCQEAVAYEVIIVVDGSRDGTAEALRQSHDPRVRVLDNARPRGVAQARNRGINAAQGQWVAFLDDDDLWSPWKLRRQLDTAADLGAKLVYSSAVTLDHDLNVLDLVPAGPADGLARQLRSANTIPAGSSNVMAQTSLLQELAGFDEALFHFADWDLWIRAAEIADAAACADVLVATVSHGLNMSVVDDARARREFDWLEEGSARDFVMRWLANEQWRAGHPWKAGLLALRAGAPKGRPRAALEAALYVEPRWLKRLRRAVGLRSRAPEPVIVRPPWLSRYASAL
jgi:glycosyltransferase involved in cell wall biosynthesis